MDIKEYLSNRPKGFKSEFAKKIGISKSFLWQIATGYTKAPIYLAKRIEELTNGDIKKSDIRPDIWD